MNSKTIIYGWLFIAGLSLEAAGQSGSLQALIDKAPPGGRVTVSSGVYSGNIAINKRLSIRGEGWPIIRGDSTTSVVSIQADSCVLEGFIIERSGDNLMHEDAGVFLKGSHSVIRGNQLRDVLFGVYLLEADSNTIEENRITGRRKEDLGQRGSGIHIWNSNYNTFTGNIITEARDGFYIQYAHHTQIERNEVFGLRYGVHYMYADSNAFIRNTFSDNVAGAAIMYSTGITMRHNVFSRNRGFSSFGILFQDCHGMVADSNVISDNVVGMFFEATTDNIFRHNIVAQNDIALQMFQNSTGNVFTENNFIDNISPLSIVGRKTETRWSVNGQGNFWSSYEGYDMNGDGVGDVPMKVQNVFQYLEGRSANLRLYLYSPASQALAAAAKAFPIIEINSEVDGFPLMRPVDLRNMPALRKAKELMRPGETARTGAGAWLAVPLLSATLIGFFCHRITRRGKV
ncbi:MAG: nitrous oxide reductase family maturation protein NosD [Ignavibacteriae bacterium]|nr:nitrous oxide reductase family maturation protein NosD [Ignavibacteriota bacterium]